MHKFYKLHIYNITLNPHSSNNNISYPNNTQLLICSKYAFNKVKLKQVPLQDVTNLKLGITIQQNLNKQKGFGIAYDQFIVSCSLIDVQGQNVFAQGEIIVDSNSLQTKGNIQYICKVNSLEESIAIIKIGVSIDEQKVVWNCQSQSQDNSDTKQWQNKNKKISFLQPSLHKTRKHHFAYLIHSQQPQISINNKILSQSIILIRNISFQVLQLPQTIKFINKQNNQLLAQITCHKNATIGKLKKIKIKLPAQANNIAVQIINKYGEMAQGSLSFDILQKQTGEDSIKQGEIGIRNLVLRDRNNYKINKMQLHYQFMQQQSAISQNKQQITKNINNYWDQSPVSIAQFLSNSNENNKKNFNDNFNKLLQSLCRRPKLSFTKNINQIILPTPKPKNSSGTQINKIQQFFIQSFASSPSIQKVKYKLPQRKLQTIQSNNTDRGERILSHKWKVKISSILVQLHSAFMIKYNINVDRDSNIGKLLQVYASSSQVFRSDVIYASQSLSWKLKNCEIFMNDYQNLVVEVCFAVEKSSLGEAVISLEKMKSCIEKGSYYKGNLIYNKQIIGQIIINFRMKQLDYSSKKQRKSTTQLSRLNQRLRFGLPHLKSVSAMKRNEGQQKKSIRFSTLQQIPQKLKKRKRFITSPKQFSY